MCRVRKINAGSFISGKPASRLGEDFSMKHCLHMSSPCSVSKPNTPIDRHKVRLVCCWDPSSRVVLVHITPERDYFSVHFLIGWTETLLRKAVSLEGRVHIFAPICSKQDGAYTTKSTYCKAPVLRHFSTGTICINQMASN